MVKLQMMFGPLRGPVSLLGGGGGGLFLTNQADNFLKAGPQFATSDLEHPTRLLLI